MSIEQSLKSKRARNRQIGVEITRVSRAHSKYTGVKTPIPATYARDLGVQAGDQVAWESTIENGIRVLKVRKYISPEEKKE